MSLQPWLVVSPEYGTKIDIGLDDGTGPLEYGADVVFVEAESREDARLLGVLLFKAQGARYLDHADSPYAGVQVESQMCSRHGLPTWDAKEQAYRCLPCEAEEDTF